VYKIPPLTANEGHRANNWGDLASPLWKGRLRILENSKGAALHLDDAQTGELFFLMFPLLLTANLHF
jgi:ABC-type Fe3+ transport system substrate-binding protein